MSLLGTFHWFEATGIGSFGRRSAYFFPIVEVAHLLGLTVLLGTALVLNLRLLGAVMRRQPIAELARATAPLLWSGAALTVCSGLLLFLSEAVKCYYNVAFWYKMGLVSCAVVFQLLVQPSLRVAPGARATLLLKGSAAVSLLLWFGVAVAGRAIAFV
jgi:hypothetical protein